MNIWIAKLGKEPFSVERIQSLSETVSEYTGTQQSVSFQYKSGFIHYLSYCTNERSKIYHFDNQESILGYSGLLVGNGSKNIDLRKAEYIDNAISDLSDVSEFATGQFALFKASDGNFECIVDNLGSYKVFYYSVNQTVFVTNFPKFFRILKSTENNIEFYVHYIAASGTFGTKTDDLNVFSLPEFGRLQWDKFNGLKISQYKSLSDLVNNHTPYEALVKNAATRMQGASKYLTNYHKVALSMSGGFDSRLILRSFWGLDNDSVSCFSFPDNLQDVKLAKKATKSQGLIHKTLQASPLPTFEEMFQYSEKVLTPFRNFDNVLGFSYKNDFENLFADNQYVLLNGNGGDIDDYGVKKFKMLDQLEGQEAIHSVIKTIVNKDILTPEGYEKICNNLQEHYENKYGLFLSNRGTNHKLRLFYFLFDRFGSYHGYKFFLNYFDNNYFLPFANVDFIKAALSQDRPERLRNNKHSLHKELNDLFTNGNDKVIPFTDSLHWDTGYLKHVQHNIQNKIKKKFSGYLPQRPKKYSSQLRTEFYNQNLEEYLEIFHSKPNSSIWDYLDKKKITSHLENVDYEYKNGGELLSKIAPLLYSNELNGYPEGR